ncbi:MAG: DUF3108 domain-containing protein [Acetobacteraceae bacterium]
MLRAAPSLLAVLLLSPVPAPAQDATDLHASYDLYAAGFHVAEIEVAFGVGRHSYEVRLAFHTTGVVSLFHHGHQLSTVVGTWEADRPQPQEFESVGVWQGEDKVTLMDYLHGQPLVRKLIPAQDKEREPVPLSLQQNSVDSLSALAFLVRRVTDTGRCEASLHMFDGNRASEITAHTAGEEMLLPNSRSAFSGKTLRCDFVGQMLAGFLYEDNTPFDRRPLHGSAWLASVVPGAPPVPVQMAFDTRWFGEATMYLTQLGQTPPTEVASH